MVKTDSGVTVDTVSYQYDVDGVRVAKNDDGIVTNYLVDKNRDYGQVIKELDGANNTTVSYLYGDDLISQSRAANDSYYLYDGLGSTRALSDSTGAITDTYDYDAYGQLVNSSGTTDNSYRYTGEQYDANLSNYYLRARYYNPANGRFTTMDAWMGNNQDPVTLHKYAYGNLDPVNTIDPSGHFGLGSIGAALNAAARLGVSTIRSSISLARILGTRVNGRIIKGVASLKTRVWLIRNIGQVQSKLPKKLFEKGKLSKNKKGWRWGDEKNNVRVSKANPNSEFASQRVDYVQIRVDGKGMIGRNGQKISTKFSDEAHIPLSEWKTWVHWNSLL